MGEEALGPGWEAITGALERVHGAQAPKRWGTLIRWALGGPDPLDGVSAWGAPGHWHFVSYGLSELYEKRSEAAELSGWGFELTFRLVRREGETSPPQWPVVLMQSLARYVFETGNVFRPGDHLEHDGPLGGDPSSELSALAFVSDPELGTIETPHGRVRFVQMVGLTLDELEAIKDWRAQGVLDLIRERSPLLVTDLRRRSIRAEPDVEARVRAGIARDGSSEGAVFVEQLSWRTDESGTVRLELGAIAVPDLLRVLRSRIPHGRPFRMLGPEASVVFWPEGQERDSEEMDDGVLFVELDAEGAEAMQQGLEPRAGVYRWAELSGLELEVVPTEIRDGSGEVVRTVG